MKPMLRKLFSPLLKPFEAGDLPYAYKPSHRVILVIMCSLFSGLAVAVSFVAPGDSWSFLIPVFVFGGLGFIGLLVGLLGTDRAVSKIWGSR